ncbi:hypothetical protein [Rubellimicrobium mesophilum]|uniref:hypothetical protein n=1 Tax=Rubellimicrobium mesophilum TaxID=1123067 RepID=UPI0012E19B77|nr:hypothetical protein [Rubellimicrobium mesophilum]
MEETASKARLAGLHARLFPEEYGFYYDDSVDAKRRARGENPMSQDYIDRTSGRRQALGLAPYSGGYGGGESDTQGWVRRMVHDGRQDELLALADRYAEEDERRRREETPTLEGIPPEKLGAEVDAYLLDWKGSRLGQWSKEETEVLGIYGFFLGKNASEKVFESLVLRELRRLNPAEEEDTLRGRMGFAKSYWIEAYCG